MTKQPTDYLVTPDLNKPEEWTYPINHVAIAQMRERVGRESDKGTDRLSDAIAGRTVALLLNGGSIKELEDTIKGFACFDLCFMGINRFSAIERDILAVANKAFDIVFCMSEQDIPCRIRDIRGFLARDEKPLLMTTLCALTWLDEADRNWLLDVHSKQLYLMPRLLCRPAYPISMEVIIDELIKVGVGQLILFGADGYMEPAMKGNTELEIIRWNQRKMLDTYYDQDFFKLERRATGVGVGTVRFNKNFRYEPAKMRIVNCSPNSHYEHIPKMSYEQVLGALAVGGL